MIDAGDFLRDPETYLRWLCDWLGIAFTAADAVVAGGSAQQRRRVGAVLVRRGAGAPPASSRGVPARCRLSPHDAAVAEACRPAYDALHALRLRL